ncbi:leucine zipper domain-containing protein [Mycobacteroides abscessus]|uniref:leucine zipper domain-containing protein n=1 Tax=Mycobacteroides abscessus TaxID=36809 RepID=UPI0009A88A29|nr:leucine zipper domain-containing protein [Mycobacteroides abscessus]
MSTAVKLAIGARFWMDGAAWTVQELEAGTVVLAAGDRVRRVSVNRLAAEATALGGQASVETDHLPVAVALGCVSAEVRGAAEARAVHIRELASAATPADRAAMLRSKATELGVSVMTLRRWLAAYETSGVAGLLDARVSRPTRRAVHPLWDAACLAELRRYTNRSTPTKGAIVAAIALRLETEHGPGQVPIPSQATAYRRLDELAKGKYAFGSGKARRSVAKGPSGPYGRLHAAHPGEYVVLDTTPLDVFAMEPVTLRWVPVELTVAMDLYSRCVLGLRLTPVSTKAADVANVLYQCVSPERAQQWPFHGVPQNVLVKHEDPQALRQWKVGDRLACMPEAIVIDRGSQYMSAHVLGACARLGITVQPAIPNKPTDKPAVERFFRTLREGLLQHLPAYKGPDVCSRGADVEDEAFYYVTELEQIIREWVGTIYHRTKHEGLCVPEVPGVNLSPTEMFEIGVAKSGELVLPTSSDLAYEFLDVRWRTIQHYGVEFDGRIYDGSALNLYRNRRSPYTGEHAGLWPIFTDVHDVRFAYFQDPETKCWHQLHWEHAAALDQPFSKDAAEYVKRISLRENRHVEPGQAVRDLLAQWSRGEVTSRRDRGLARRLSAQRSAIDVGTDDDDQQAAASLPGVIDLLEQRNTKRAQLEVVDDIDVFAQYYAENPDAQGLEVFDE